MQLWQANGGAPATANGPMGSSSETTVLLQGFNWESSRITQGSWYSVVERKAETIADCGITAVWLPPPSQSVSSEGYMPRELEQLDSAYGTEAELRSCIRAMHASGIKVLADAVLNHRCASRQSGTGVWNQYGGRYSWNASAICSNSWEYEGAGAKKQEVLFTPAPNIDHSNARVRADIKHWLTWLRTDVQFDGFRFDYTKGYSGRFVQEYIEACKPELAVAEYWDDCEMDSGGALARNQDAHRQRIVDWCDSAGGTAAAFDFTTKGILQEALARREFSRLRDSRGQPSGMIGYWPTRAVTFLENHDTGSTQQHWPFPQKHLWMGYAYILTHPGTPCVFYDHLFADATKSRKSLSDCLSQRLGCMGGGLSCRLTPLGVAISAMISIRRRNKITCASTVDICEASDGGTYAAIIDGRIAVRLGASNWQPASPTSTPPMPSHALPHAPCCKAGVWKLALSGILYCIWEWAEVCVSPIAEGTSPSTSTCTTIASTSSALAYDNAARRMSADSQQALLPVSQHCSSSNWTPAVVGVQEPQLTVGPQWDGDQDPGTVLGLQENSTATNCCAADQGADVSQQLTVGEQPVTEADALAGSLDSPTATSSLQATADESIAGSDEADAGSQPCAVPVPSCFSTDSLPGLYGRTLCASESDALLNTSTESLCASHYTRSLGSYGQLHPYPVGTSMAEEQPGTQTGHVDSPGPSQGTYWHSRYAPLGWSGGIPGLTTAYSSIPAGNTGEAAAHRTCGWGVGVPGPTTAYSTPSPMQVHLCHNGAASGIVRSFSDQVITRGSPKALSSGDGQTKGIPRGGSYDECFPQMSPPHEFSLPVGSLFKGLAGAQVGGQLARESQHRLLVQS